MATGTIQKGPYIEHGFVTSVSVSAGAYADKEVSFKRTFTNGNDYDAFVSLHSARNNADVGNVMISSRTKGTGSLTVRIFNTTETDMSLHFHWMIIAS